MPCPNSTGPALMLIFAASVDEIIAKEAANPANMSTGLSFMVLLG
jgi:hypothetical protein